MGGKHGEGEWTVETGRQRRTPIKLLTFSTLYPNAAQPYHGLFVERRLQHLAATGEVESRVVAPVPWFPSSSEWFGRYGRFARVPRSETRGGFTISHPRFPVVPKIGMSLGPFLMERAVFTHVRDACRERSAELIDAHYFYPDGVAAARLGRRLALPVVITARGSDLNLIADFPAPRQQIVRAARECAAIITVSEALKNKLVAIGAPADKITVLRNGVDLDMFRPLESSLAQAGTDRPTFLTVGNLLPEKGQDVALRALARMPDAELLVAGDGPLRGRLEGLANELGIASRVTFLGQVHSERLVELYNRAAATILASTREGMPNVILESLACGTPVIASAVGGIPEVVTEPEAGIVVSGMAPDTLLAAMNSIVVQPRARSKVRAFATRLGWDATVRGQIALYRGVLVARGVSASAA
jgi:teichuronic acid biosynthesis glycosyltransferase TuaC